MLPESRGHFETCLQTITMRLFPPQDPYRHKSLFDTPSGHPTPSQSSLLVLDTMHQGPRVLACCSCSNIGREEFSNLSLLTYSLVKAMTGSKCWRMFWSQYCQFKINISFRVIETGTNRCKRELLASFTFGIRSKWARERYWNIRTTNIKNTTFPILILIRVAAVTAVTLESIGLTRHPCRVWFLIGI